MSKTTTRHSTTSAFTRSSIALLAILVLAFTVRIIGIDWDEGRYLHPDERHIVADVLVGRVEVSWPPRTSWLDADDSAINPRPQREDGTYEEFAYGAFPVYTVDTIGAIAEQFTGTDWNGYQRASYIGRGISILLDTGTVLLVFLLGAALAGRTAGLLGATVYAFLPVAIQASHFFTVDSWMTFFVFATILACLRAVQHRRYWLFALAGGLSGFALATKLSAAPVVLLVALAVALAAFDDAVPVRSSIRIARRFLARGMLAAIAFVAIFILGEPFAILDTDALLTSFRTQSDIQTGRFDVPFTQQYVDTSRLTYHLGEAIRYSLGPVAVLLGFAGALVLGWMVARRRSPAAALLAAWLCLTVVTILVPETKFPRYLLPIAPAVAILAGIAIALGLMFLNRRVGKPAGVLFATVMMLLASGYGAAFANVNQVEHSRISASVWMYENLPPGSTTTSELWDDRLPLSVMPGLSSDALRIDDASINLYATTPTYGDIAMLAEPISLLPNGDSISSALRSGNVPEAAAQLRDIDALDLGGSVAAARLPQLTSGLSQSSEFELIVDGGLSSRRFAASLVTAGLKMTTSNDLVQRVTPVVTDITDTGRITPSQLAEIAAAIEQSASQSMVRHLYTQFEDADYYVVASDRVERGMEQNPWRYAVPNRMYELLDSGDIGFEQVNSFAASPSLFGMTFPDASADESFLNYDHPTVRIYEKSELVSYDRFLTLFGSAALEQTQPTRSPESEPLTLDEPVSDLPVVDDFRWSESVSSSSWGAAGIWVILLIALQVAGLPLAATVFRAFPDGGWGLARVGAIVVPATLLWWCSSVGLLHFRAVWVVTAFALFALANWLWFRRSLAISRARLNVIVIAEVVFWLAFVVFLIFKMVNPDSWHPYFGGEKPMEFAQINAILRSPEFPPVDPWYAQGYINYYYYGFYLIAYLIKLTGVPTEFAFNLAQPMVMGLLASGTFSVGAAISRRLSRGRIGGLVGGLVAVAFVSFAGNLLTIGQVVDNYQGEPAVGTQFDHWVWAPSRAIPFTITEFPYFTGLYGDLHSHVVGLPLLVLSIALAAAFAFSRDLPRESLPVHRVALIGLTAIALGIVYPTNAWDLPATAGLIVGGVIIGSATARTTSQRLKTLALTLSPISLGALVVTLPFLLKFEALFGAAQSTRTTTTLLELESHLGGPLLVATAAVPALFALHGFRRRWLDPTLLFATLTATLLLRWAAVDLAPELVQWLDVATVAIVAVIWIASIPGILGRYRRLDFGLPLILTPAIAVISVVAVVWMIVVDRNVAALYLAIGLSSLSFLLSRRSAAARFVALLATGACFIGAGAEFVFVVDDLAGSDWYRMNTIFKFYNQIWILLGIAGGSAAGVFISSVLGRLVVAADESAATGPFHESSRPTRTARPWAVVTTSATAVAILLSSAYPVVATDIRLATRYEPREGGLTLNAYSWMDYGTVELSDGTVITFDEDRDVIDWFNHDVGGTPVIAEAAFGPYRCNSSRISIATGLPSVLGWQRHEMQQRYQDVLPQREADLRTLYGSGSVDEKLAIINRYDIQYIVVGDLERHYPVLNGNGCVPMNDVPAYDRFDLEAGIAAIESMEGVTLEIAYRSGDTIVYKVNVNS